MYWNYVFKKGKKSQMFSGSDKKLTDSFTLNHRSWILVFVLTNN